MHEIWNVNGLDGHEKHIEDFLVCLVKIKGINGNHHSNWMYPDLKPGSDLFRTLVTFQMFCRKTLNLWKILNQGQFANNLSAPTQVLVIMNLIHHVLKALISEFDDLVRGLNFWKKPLKPMASSLKKKDLLVLETKVTYYRSIEKRRFCYSVTKISH